MKVLVLREGDTVARGGLRGDYQRRSLLVLGRRGSKGLSRQLQSLGVALLLGGDQTRKGGHGRKWGG